MIHSHGCTSDVHNVFVAVLQLDWHKNTLGKSLVQSGAESDSKRCWARLVACLQQHIAAKGGLVLPDDAAGSAAAHSIQPSGACSSSESSGSVAAKNGVLLGMPSGGVVVVIGLLLVLLVVLLVVLVASVRSGSAKIAGELHQLTAVLGTLGTQCIVPSPGLIGYMTG
jgi:hypothetical protein